MLGEIESRKRRGRQRVSRLDGITDPMDMSVSKLGEMVRDGEAWHAAVYGSVKTEAVSLNLHFLPFSEAGWRLQCWARAKTRRPQKAERCLAPALL